MENATQRILIGMPTIGAPEHWHVCCYHGLDNAFSVIVTSIIPTLRDVAISDPGSFNRQGA